jgi:hypothetical protein
MREIMSRVKNMARGSTPGLTDQDMKVNGRIINYTVMESIVGQTEEDMRVDGKILICTVKVNIPGRMVDFMRVNIIMIKNMAMVSINGLMEKSMKVDGLRDNNMERVNISIQMEKLNIVFMKNLKKSNISQRRNLKERMNDSNNDPYIDIVEKLPYYFKID